ncbi:phosphatidylinositol kinase [Alloacidobacterium dinghuense]|uniref:Phosphatidylinositol kinase n=1 Tax=Alloacidobacterium dinghuense TaxID=2763107 RepID=A0A7G8BGE9_9BACT|nr:HipA family kinase [Alloacidobacterium dinghuense]QNI31619.1 phosphatidylinositol kinase [Alloacidobacterium dinghuense]
MAVLATQAIRRMRGGAQSHLMLASDGHPYVVKFQNNPQHIRVLANELMATRLAEAVGLSVPASEIVEVTDWLIQNSKELSLDLGQTQEQCRPGLQFGSRLVGGLMPGQVVDYLPEERLAEVKNLAEFFGMLVIDKWTCNSNGRQAVFYKRPREKRYAATFIDQGYCFNAGEWKFVDAPLRGVYARNLVYRGVVGWDSFEPWLSRAEELDPQKIWSIAEIVPPEWYGGDLAEIETLIERLLERRSRIRELITLFQESSRQPFPNWMTVSIGAIERQFPEPSWADTIRGPIM